MKVSTHLRLESTRPFPFYKYRYMEQTLLYNMLYLTFLSFKKKLQGTLTAKIKLSFCITFFLKRHIHGPTSPSSTTTISHSILTYDIIIGDHLPRKLTHDDKNDDDDDVHHHHHHPYFLSSFVPHIRERIQRNASRS
jgi:hypothetical protein